MNKTILVLAFSLLSINLCTAQISLNAAGGDFVNHNATLSYSIGQLFIQTNSPNEGVQIPYNIVDISGIDNLKDISFNLVVYPNPTSDYLELKIDNKDFDFNTGYYKITDINGNTIISEKISQPYNKVAVSNLSKGTYLLEVIDGNKTLKTLKITKK
jgi:hypothetical protein